MGAKAYSQHYCSWDLYVPVKAFLATMLNIMRPDIHPTMLNIMRPHIHPKTLIEISMVLSVRVRP